MNQQRPRIKRNRLTLAPTLVLLLASFLSACSQPPTEDTAANLDVPAISETARATTTVTNIAVDNAMAGWIDTGVPVAQGDSFALFGRGEWEVQGLKLTPKLVMWHRVGENGKARNFKGAQEVVTADTDGNIYVALRPITVVWQDKSGSFPEGFSDAPPMPTNISVDIALLDNVEAGLTALDAAGVAGAAEALEQIASPTMLPEGFAYLDFLTRSTLWSDRTVDGRPGIKVATTDDVGIVKMPVDIALNDSTTIDFDWRYDNIPALGPEDQTPHHDYISIALEFDNGQDLTWYWSKVLPEGTHFTCPLPWWDERETHYVLQSGEAGLGEWHSHTRNVLSDYRESITKSEPARIVGVWFIGNSIFARQAAAASFTNVVISTGDESVVVFNE